MRDARIRNCLRMRFLEPAHFFPAARVGPVPNNAGARGVVPGAVSGELIASVPRAHGSRRAAEAIVHAELDHLDGLAGSDGERRGWVEDVSGEGHVSAVEIVIIAFE